VVTAEHLFTGLRIYCAQIFEAKKKYYDNGLKSFLMSILTPVWNFVNISCDQSKSNNALENQTKCCVVQLESFGVQLCDGSYKAITYLLPLTTIYIL
jgi:hypothetical protein